MEDLLIMPMTLFILGFTIAGYLSKFKMLLLISVGFIIPFSIYLGEAGHMTEATVLSGLAILNVWAAFSGRASAGGE